MDAALVNVMTRISDGLIPCFSIRYFVLSVITVVFPEPGPARQMQGPAPWATALD